MDNKQKTDRIFEQLPKFLNARNDANWSSLVSAIGSEDQRLADLIEEVRKQFFVKTASRPHIDRLAANSNLSRPRFVGMSDTDFRKYIPILSYQPKQVKLIIDQLLDLFFFKEATTAFLSSGLFEPFILKDGWSLQLLVDNIYNENIKFKAADFTDISNATAVEIAAAYNRQARYTYAVNYFDSVTDQIYVRIFSNTIGAQGAIQVVGGIANIGLQLNGFMSDLGTGNNTQWSVMKIGNQMTFTHSGGVEPGVELLEIGDVFLSDITGNQGSFVITSVDVRTKSFTFENILGTAGSFTQNSDRETKFLRPVKVTSYGVPRRALAWETGIGKITVELPATPPIVQRELKGGFHVNGSFGLVSEVNSSTSLTVVDATNFPESGSFVIEPIDTITSRLTGGTADKIETTESRGRIISEFQRYSYSGLSGTTLTGISPNLPEISSLQELTLTSLSKAGGVVTATVNNSLSAGDKVFITGSSGIPILTTTGTSTLNSAILTGLSSTAGVAPDQLINKAGVPAGTKVVAVLSATSVSMTKIATATSTSAVVFAEDTNGAFELVSATPTSVTWNQLGANGTAVTAGKLSNEKIQLAESGFRILITTSVSSDITKIVGPYVWDLNAPFTLSADISTLTNEIQAGKVYKLLQTDTNSIPAGDGYLVFDYGQNNQEGPVRYLYKPAENIIALDPSYTFQRNHVAGSSVVAVSKLGPHTLDGLGSEYAPYVTNPPDARLILQELITSVASAGIFIDFIVRYPSQLYGTLEVYD